MATHLELPRSSDQPDVSTPARPVDPDAVETLEVDPPTAGGFNSGTDPAARPPSPSSEPTQSTLTPPALGIGPTTTADPAHSPASAAGAAGAQPTPGAEPAKPTGPRLNRPRRQARRRWDAPAWAVSAGIHVLILGGLALVATTSGEVVKQLASLDSALVDNNGPKEETPILNDPADVAREQAVGDLNASSPSMNYNPSGGGVGALVLKSTGRSVRERTALPTVGSVAAPSNLSMVATTPTRDLGDSGMIGGDVTNVVNEVGEALDQVAREILRHLAQHRLTVVWMFDESESMRDDQKAIKAKFDRVVNELKINGDDVAAPEAGKAGDAKKRPTGPPLAHAIVGFGNDVHYEQDKPTADISLISRAIDRLRIDSTGKENTMSAVVNVINHYDGLINNDRRLLIVLATDESGDDGDLVEEARQAALKNKVPIYVIGRQSLFGTDHLTINYTDPVTKDVYQVGIKRGPETADVESLQYDGLHRRWDEIPSGFAPYELARLAKDTGGIYFLLPSEEALRIHKREKAYSIATLKEYVPDYESRQAYVTRRNKSELRQTLREVIAITKDFPYRHHFPVMPNELLPAIQQELPIVNERLAALIAIEKRLRSIEKYRDREPEKRWQAAYDLMLAQVVIYQIKAYEYRANLLEMANNPPKPKQLPTPELSVAWSLDHNKEHKAPNSSTEKVYAEALRLAKLVIERHPITPWADLAQDEINRGFSIKRNEWHHKHSAQFEERKKLIPKF